MTLTVLVVGRGKVAAGLRRATRRKADLQIRERSHGRVRDADIAWAEIVLLAVPDGAIRATAEALAPRVGRVPVLHLSGNRPVSEAAACSQHGALHPLSSFASKRAPPDLTGTYFAVAGTPTAKRAGVRVARALGGHVLHATDPSVALQGPAYHAAAAVVANGAAALAASGVDILTRLGVARARAQRAVAALLRTVADNVEDVGVPSALTGPVMRGDASTVAAHRLALQQLGGRSAEVYDAAALAVLGCAIDAGLTGAEARAVRAALGPDGAPASSRAPRGRGASGRPGHR
ncbi:MAG: DUF2520 domain-containing protein [Polyangiales bacterium]